MPKPTSFPEWATDPTLTPADILEPSQVKKEIGWVQGEIPPREFFNWLTKNQYDWIKWFDDTIDTTIEAVTELLAFQNSLLNQNEERFSRNGYLVPHIQETHPLGGGTAGPVPVHQALPGHRNLRLYRDSGTFTAAVNTDLTPNNPATYWNPAFQSADGSWSRIWGKAGHEQQNYNGTLSVEDDGGYMFKGAFRYTLDGMLYRSAPEEYRPQDIEVMTQVTISPGNIERTYTTNAALPGEYYWVVFDAERAVAGLPGIYITQVPWSMRQWAGGMDARAFSGHDYSKETILALIKVIDQDNFNTPVACFGWLMSGDQPMFGPQLRVGQTNPISVTNATPRVEPIGIPVPGAHYKSLREAVRALGIMRGEWNRVGHSNRAGGPNELHNLATTMLIDGLEYGDGIFDEIEVVGRCYEGVNPWIQLFSHLKIRGKRDNGERYYTSNEENSMKAQIEWDFYDWQEWANNGLEICLASSLFRCNAWDEEFNTSYILEDVTIEGCQFHINNQGGVQNTGHHDWYPDHLNVPEILAIGSKVVDISPSDWNNLVVSNFTFRYNWCKGLLSNAIMIGATWLDDVIDIWDLEITNNQFDNMGDKVIMLAGELLYKVKICDNKAEGRWGQFASEVPQDDGFGNWTGVGFQDISETNYFAHLIGGGAFYIMDDIWIERNELEHFGTKVVYLETDQAYPDNIVIRGNSFLTNCNRTQWLNTFGSSAAAGFHPCKNPGLGGTNLGIRYVDMHVVEIFTGLTYARNILVDANEFDGNNQQSAYYVSVATWPSVDRYLIIANQATAFNFQNNVGYTPPEPDPGTDPVVTQLGVPSGVIQVNRSQAFCRGSVTGNTDGNVSSPMSFLIGATNLEETAPPRIAFSAPNGAPFPDSVIGDAADDYSNSPIAWYRF